MRIEVFINGRLIATKEVPEAEIRNNPYASDEANHERREKIIKSYLKEIKTKLRPILAMYSSYDIQYSIVFPSKMNNPNFKIKEDNQLKTA